jgi:subtilisin family serine protease
MSHCPWRVAVIDSGLSPASRLGIGARCWCGPDGRLEVKDEPREDSTGHGTRVATLIASTASPPRLFVAQVLNERGVGTVAAVVTAIRWAVSEQVDLIHMSLGLSADRQDLANAVSCVVEHGVIVVASSPARGVRPFPACYPGVVAATGDARCDRAQISALGAANADFGGCVHVSAQPTGPGRGASIGAAHVTRFIVERLSPGISVATLKAKLIELATHHGVERR